MNFIKENRVFKTIENIELTDFHSAGRAIGKKGNRNIYVDFGIPGEKVDLEIPRRQKQGSFTIGKITKLHEQSPFRAIQFCKHFGICGGCNWQHLQYEAQLHWKMQILINALKKYKIVSPEIPEVLPSPQLIYYRNKIEYAFSAYGFSNENNSEDIKPVLGFHPINRPEQVLEIEECYLQKQPSRDICESLHQFAMQHGYKYYNAIDNTGFLKSLTIRTSTTGDLMAIICFSKDYETPRDKILDFLKHHFPEITSLYYSIQNIGAKGFRDDLYFHYSGNSTITEKIDEVKFQISSGSFFQLNPFQAVNLYRKIKEFARLDSNEFAYDLYTGTGSIACYLAKDAGRIMGIEGSACAIADAKINAEINGFYNLEFLTGDILETFKPEFIARHGKPDVIILDPPRSGTLIEIKKTILHAAPSRIVYVSCNPVSLAWDLKQLCENYHIVAIQPFDMFPHTHHLETVVLLEPK